MTHCFELSGETGILSLSGPLTIEHAAALKTAVVDAFGVANRLDLNLADVSILDLCCLQLFCSAHKSAVREGRTLKITAGGEALADSLANNGFLRHVACNDCQGHECFWSLPAAGDSGGTAWE